MTDTYSRPVASGNPNIKEYQDIVKHARCWCVHVTVQVQANKKCLGSIVVPVVFVIFFVDITHSFQSLPLPLFVEDIEYNGTFALVLHITWRPYFKILKIFLVLGLRCSEFSITHKNEIQRPQVNSRVLTSLEIGKEEIRGYRTSLVYQRFFLSST